MSGSEAQSCEIICNMLAMLSCSEKLDANRTLLAMTNSPESCQSLRRAGCIPLLVQILHPGSTTPPDSQPSAETKVRASKALKNIVHFNRDEKMKRKESSVLRHLEAVRGFTSSTKLPEPEKHPTTSSTSLMRHSFDEDHKNIMCTLGAIHALADLIVSDHRIHGSQTTDAECILTRRYSCMTLTNLTFGDGLNKALLCSMTEFLQALVSQLEFENEDIVQVTASVLRNLSWHAESNSRASLRDCHAVSALMKAALRATKESTLKATLSALWNLSAHSNVNKAAICSTPNALKFLLSLLRRSKSMTIVENAGGILGNISTHITGVEEHRASLQENHCFEILLEHLKSSSLTVVSNACGTLWNLSGHQEEQRKLLELNAMPMLKSLIYSKHERISQGATAALRNLLTYYEHTNNLQRGGGKRMSTSDPENEQPLDLTITSCKSSPVRKLNPPPFLNPPIYNGSVSSTRSCPNIQVQQNQLQQQQTNPSPQKQRQKPQPQKMEPSSDDTTFNYSHYDEMEEEEEEEEKHHQKDTVKTYCDEGTPGFSGSMADLSSQAVDSFIEFRVEDTPAIFSRTSSLSSIDEGNQNQNQHGENIAEKIQDNKKSQVGGSCKRSRTVSVSAQSPIQNSILVANNNVSNSSMANPPVIPKRVMFSAEETPLMFSRCSSVASLESCGDLNINNGRESDCVSEFSRRTSGIVSPSELPDSPRATDHDSVANSQEPSLDQQDPDFNAVDHEHDHSNRKKTTSATHDELKVFAQEGTPFLISTTTSLSDIIGELDNQSAHAVPIAMPVPIQAPVPLPRNSLNQIQNQSHVHSDLQNEIQPQILSDQPLLNPSLLVQKHSQQHEQPENHEEEEEQENFEPQEQQQHEQPKNLLQQQEQQQNQESPQRYQFHKVSDLKAEFSSNSDPPTAETEPEESIYSDDQLLQKVIKVGRAVGVGLAKRLPLHLPLLPHHEYQRQLQQQQQLQQQDHSSMSGSSGGVAEDEEIDLSHLIQRGRAKLIMTRSEDNLKQYTTDGHLSSMRPFDGPFTLSIPTTSIATTITASDPQLLDSAEAQQHQQQYRRQQPEVVMTMPHKFTTMNNVNGGSIPPVNQGQNRNKNENLMMPNINSKLQPAQAANNVTNNTNSLNMIPLKLQTSKSIDGLSTATKNLTLGPSFLQNNSGFLHNPAHENDNTRDLYEDREVGDVYIYGQGDDDNDMDDEGRQTDTPTTTTATTISATTPTTAKENMEILFADDVTDDNTDNTTDDNTPSIDDNDQRTWTDETPSFSSPIPSMSINKALKKVQGEMDETLSEIEQPTLYSLGTTMDSSGQLFRGQGDFQAHSGHGMNRSMQMSMSASGIHHHRNNLHLLQSSSSQVSNLMNQKPPQDFFDLDSSMISVASIKSEIFDDGIPNYVASPVLSSYHNHNQTGSGSGTISNGPPATIINEFKVENDIGKHSPAPLSIAQPATKEATTTAIDKPNGTPSPLSKYDTYVIKRIESPKERRKNDPDRYLTRTIDRNDLKIMKPPVPPKPSGSHLVTTTVAPPPTTSTTTTVRPTRASELRASRSREHSPTNSTTSLQTTTSNKIPPKPPVRSTPPLNTTLPRNAKLMENLHSGSTGSGNQGNSMVVVMNPENISSANTNNASEPILNYPKDTASTGQKDKLNFGGRIGNLFRKSFSKHNGKSKQQQQQQQQQNLHGDVPGSNSSGSGGHIWVKRREKEKALISPFNYKPPNNCTSSHPVAIEKMTTFSSSSAEGANNSSNSSSNLSSHPTSTAAATMVTNNVNNSYSNTSIASISLRTTNSNSATTTAAPVSTSATTTPAIPASLGASRTGTGNVNPGTAPSSSAGTGNGSGDGGGKTSSKITTV